MFGSDVGLGSLLAAVLSLSVNYAQSTFRKFHLLTGGVGTELMVVDDSIIDGLCWDFGGSVRGLADSHMFQDWQNPDPYLSMCSIVLSGSYEAV